MNQNKKKKNKEENWRKKLKNYRTKNIVKKQYIKK